MIFLNGKYIEKSNAKISIDDRGFHFGDGLYDVFLIHNYKIVDFEKHAQRIENTAKRIAINLDYSVSKIFEICTKLIKENNVEKGRLILVLSRGEADRWKIDIENISQNFYIYTQNYDCGVGSGVLKSISAKLFEDVRWKYRDIKITSLLPSVIARNEANKSGFDEVLYHENGLINETSRGNVFIVKEGVVKTPPLSTKLLPGITRYRVIELLKNSTQNIEFIEENFTIDELLLADEVFSTSATARVVSISKIEDKIYTKSDITLKVLKLYDDFVLKL